MATPDTTPEPDNGPDTTPGIPPSRPAPLAPPTPHQVSDTAFRPPERDGMSGLTIGLLAAVVVLGILVLTLHGLPDRRLVDRFGLVHRSDLNRADRNGDGKRAGGRRRASLG